MYTLRNLTHVELKLCYAPLNVAGGVTEGDDSDNYPDINIPPRINTDRLQAFLHSCSDLEVRSHTSLYHHCQL